RNVARGEVIHFHNTAIDHEIWEVIEGGTCSWSGTTFTGTAKFSKQVKKKNYTSTPLNNMTAYLTNDDIGMIARVNGTTSWWAGTSTGWVPVTIQAAASANTATVSVGATPTKAEFDALLTELR